MTRAFPIDRWTPWLFVLAACGQGGSDEDRAPDEPAGERPSTSSTAPSDDIEPGDEGAPSVAGTAASPPSSAPAMPGAGAGGTAGMGAVDPGAQPDDEQPTGPDDSAAPNETDGGPPSIPFACPGGTIAHGMNSLPVGAQTRSFYAQLPADMSGPLGVVFSWHGFNDPGSDGDAAGWRAAAEVDADADPEHPTVVITPIDVDFEIPVGLDWQFDQPTSATNVDLAFFEAMLGCLNAQYAIDPTRIYSYGFSAGSVMSSLIHSAYPGLVSAVVCVSGMWFNDQAQVDMIQLLPVSGTWPELDAADGGTVLLTHGGPTDVTVLGIANLENMAQAAFPFLAGAGRVVLDCPHGGGHVLHPELSTAHVMRFFAEHRGGEPSPYLNADATGYPAGCTLRRP